MEYKGYRIEIVPDEFIENPREISDYDTNQKFRSIALATVR